VPIGIAAWGDAALRLKANRTELLTKVTDQLSRVRMELNQRQLMELNFRASYFDRLLSTAIRNYGDVLRSGNFRV
jgi:hypothetical protein